MLSGFSVWFGVFGILGALRSASRSEAARPQNAEPVKTTL